MVKHHFAKAELSVQICVAVLCKIKYSKEKKENMKKDNDIGAIFIGCLGLLTGGVLLFIVITLLSVFLNAWALTTLWGWIVVPTFHWQALLYWQAYGIVVISSFLTNRSIESGQYQRDLDTKVETSTRITVSVLSLVSPVLIVFFTWIVLHFLFAVI